MEIEYKLFCIQFHAGYLGSPCASTAIIGRPRGDRTRQDSRQADATEPLPIDTTSRCNPAFCVEISVLMAAMAGMPTAGFELAAAKGRMGGGFGLFVATRTPLNLVEARTLVCFGAEAGLWPDQLTPTHDVPLSRMFEAVAPLGGFFMEEHEQA